MNYIEISTNTLIEVVKINLVTTIILWNSFRPNYLKQPFYYNFSFYGKNYRFNMMKIIYSFELFLTLKILYDIKNV